MEKITIELTREELNYVLSCIATRPYSECSKLIEGILKQIETPESSDN